MSELYIEIANSGTAVEGVRTLSFLGICKLEISDTTSALDSGPSLGRIINNSFGSPETSNASLLSGPYTYPQ